jgi:hypothetical protein
MKNQNSFILLFLFIANIQFTHAQTVQVSTGNTGIWTAAYTGGLNALPSNPAGLNFNLTVRPYALPNCSQNININPAPQIRVSGLCDPGLGTYYYRTTFNLGNLNAICASGRIRADDAIRVYINGIQIVGNLALTCNNVNLSQLNGNNWQIAYNFTDQDIRPLLVTGQNTLIIETPNCETISYVSALFNFAAFPNNFAPLHYSIAQGVNGYTTSLWGTSNAQMRMIGFGGAGSWTGNWTVESSANQNGPWAPFASTTETSSTQSAPWVPAQFSYGTYYRVTYTITTTCGPTVTYTAIIFITCQGCRLMPQGGVDGDGLTSISDSKDNGIYASYEELFPRDEFLNPPTSADSSKISNVLLQDVIQKVFVDYTSHTLITTLQEEMSPEETSLEVYSIVGKLMWMGKIQDNISAISVSDWPNGIYVIHVRRDKQQIRGSKKVAILRQ